MDFLASYRVSQPPERRSLRCEGEERPCPDHSGDTDQKVSLTQILSGLADSTVALQIPTLSERSLFSMDSNTSLLSASKPNQCHDSDATSSLIKRWHRAAAVFIPKEDTKIPMVMCSPPGTLGKGRFVIRLLRSSLKHEFGIAFDSVEARNGRHQAILVSQDLPHFGIRKLDWLRSINGVAPANLLHCRNIMQSAYSIVLILQPWNLKSLDSHSTIKPSTVRAAIRAVDQPLVCLSQAIVTDPWNGTFQITLHRISLALPFGMPDWSKNAKSELLEDFPHLGVQKGDRLLSVNGVRSSQRKHCEKLLAAALNVELVFRRDPHTEQPPKHHMKPLDAMGAAVRSTTRNKGRKQRYDATAFKQASIVSF